MPTISKPPSAVRWQRNSLEYCRLTVSVYDAALRAARRLAQTHRRRQWVVLMDADETVIDNIAVRARTRTPATGNSRTRNGKAGSRPGSRATCRARRPSPTACMRWADWLAS
ncbi:MAG: hypothetical protein WDN03_03785 [Rhizomicrobium sp.]